jgi:hypothetical protein
MANHKFTQQSGGGGRVSTGDYTEELNIINELRQIIEDLAIIVGQVKLGDGNYPADSSIGILANNVKKNNFEAETTPWEEDDETQGYSRGSLWISTEGLSAWICVDATEGLAIWKMLTEEYIS